MEITEAAKYFLNTRINAYNLSDPFNGIQFISSELIFLKELLLWSFLMSFICNTKWSLIEKFKKTLQDL